MTILVNEKLFTEKDLSISSSGSEDNHGIFFNNHKTSSKTNEGAQLINNHLGDHYPPMSISMPLVELFIRYNTPISSSVCFPRGKIY